MGPTFYTSVSEIAVLIRRSSCLFSVTQYENIGRRASTESLYICDIAYSKGSQINAYSHCYYIVGMYSTSKDQTWTSDPDLGHKYSLKMIYRAKYFYTFMP